jgi:RimJ/RimL family protein N-acetyltransferase
MRKSSGISSEMTLIPGAGLEVAHQFRPRQKIFTMNFFERLIDQTLSISQSLIYQTRYCNSVPQHFIDIREVDRHFEIGSTFIAPTFRGGNRNIEAKYLMLTEAFENRGAVRITIKANAANVRSRRAIEKIGAKLEGLLRNQRQERDGTWRTAAYHSVIVEEWPETKERLKKILSQES